MLPPREAPARLFVCMLSHFSRVRLCETLLSVTHQAPMSMGFSRQQYWSGGCHPPGDLPDLRIEPASLTSPALAGKFFTTGTTTTGQNPGQFKNCRNTASFQDKDIPEDLNSPVSRLYGHPIGTFKFRISKHIFQKFFVCYVTQHISLGDSNCGFWGFFFGITSLSQEGQFGRNPKRTEVASPSRWRVKTGGPASCFLLWCLDTGGSRGCRRQEVSCPRAPNTFQCEQTPIPSPARAAGRRSAGCSVRTGPTHASKGLARQRSPGFSDSGVGN